MSQKKMTWDVISEITNKELGLTRGRKYRVVGRGLLHLRLINDRGQKTVVSDPYRYLRLTAADQRTADKSNNK